MKGGEDAEEIKTAHRPKFRFCAAAGFRRGLVPASRTLGLGPGYWHGGGSGRRTRFGAGRLSEVMWVQLPPVPQNL